jgi:hypothetical protein
LAKFGLPSFGDRAAQFWTCDSSSSRYGSAAGPTRTKFPAIPLVTQYRSATGWVSFATCRAAVSRIARPSVAPPAFAAGSAPE